jgi:hypothetical protein
MTTKLCPSIPPCLRRADVSGKRHERILRSMHLSLRSSPVRFAVSVLVGAAACLTIAAPSRAQDPQKPQQAPPPASPTTPPPASSTTSTSSDPQAPPQKPATSPDSSKDAKDKNRVFGVLPNYTSVEGESGFTPISNKDSFKMAALDSFDPMVYPLFGFIAAVGQAQNSDPEWGRGWSGYSKRYGAAFADNSVCSLMTTGVMPSIFGQDPRYYQGRATGFLPRLGYAAKASIVTRSRKTGHHQFNISEIGGTLVVANVGNLYYPQQERTVAGTLTRWGTQAMWDTVANELNVFWPDMRRVLHL